MTGTGVSLWLLWVWCIVGVMQCGWAGGVEGGCLDLEHDVVGFMMVEEILKHNDDDDNNNNIV